MKRKANIFFYFFLPCLAAACTVHLTARAQEDATTQYILKYRGIAEQEMERTGVPAAISLAQGILESQSGTGWLVEHSHNHFGIKCKSNWTGPVIYHNDDKRHECFRVYRTDDSSWRDHSDFLKNTARYAFLFYLNPLDYKAWAYGLKQAGYATRKDYPQQLIGLIERYHLQQYSRLALAEEKKEDQDGFAAMLEKKTEADSRRNGTPAATPAPVPPSAGYPAGVFRINGRDVVYLQRGTDLITVAERHHIRLGRLISYNELPGGVLQDNMLVYLQKKKKTGLHATHVLAAGESLHAVAQEEGIRLKWLLRRNGIREGETPRAGTVLYLQGQAPSVSQQDGRRKGRGLFAALARLFSPGHRDGDRETADAGPASAASAAGRDQGMTDAAAPAAEMATSPAQAGGAGEAAHTYEVKRGDTLYGISRKYGVTVEQIRAWNHLQGNIIHPGEELIVKN